MAQISFTGNLGGEAKIDFSQRGNAKLAFNVADTNGKKDANGQWDKSLEKTQWFRCTLWGPDAEYYADRLRKGARVTVYGELMAREYVDNTGTNRTSMDVTVRGLSVINKRGTETAVATSQPTGNFGAPPEDPWATPPQPGFGQQSNGWPQ